jgi:pyruvate dehydrogenase E2 component (dihydrolipoamide acetyltransferase)
VSCICSVYFVVNINKKDTYVYKFPKKINMAIAVVMPRQGQSVETCIITTWYRKKGDPVKQGDMLFSYETDKAAFDAEAAEDGHLIEVFAMEGDEVPVLSIIAVIGHPGDDISEIMANVQPSLNVETGFKPVSTNADSKQPNTESTSPDETIRISPRARVMAHNLGIQAESVTGTGPNGRIIVRDIENAKIHGIQPHQPEWAGPDYQEKKVSNMRKIIARTMHESLSTSAQLTHHMSADVRKLLSCRNEIKANASKGGPNITINDMMCFAVIRALKKFPEVNSHFTGETIRTFHQVHLGLAVDTPRGLMVPSLRGASEYSLPQLSIALKEMADQCRKGSIDPGILSSSAASFTISNLGNYGVEMFTPIINLPQVAVLGVNTIIYRPADMGEGIIGFIPVIGLSLTYDHRALDGGPATQFLREIKLEIENFKM